MGINVLENNEVAFKNRYGYSIENNIWFKLTEEERISVAKKGNSIINDDILYEVEGEDSAILHVLVGFNYLYLENRMKKSIHTTRIVVWEPDDALFAFICTQIDISHMIMDKKVRFVIGGDRSELKTALEENVFENNVRYKNIIGFREHLNPEDIDRCDFIELFKEVADDVVTCGNIVKTYHKFPYGNLIYAISIFANNSTIDDLFDRIPTRDVPIILVSAGPSLIKNCALLNEAKGKALIIVMTHAMRTVHALGVRPDMVSVTDSEENTFMDMACKDGKSDLPMISSVFGAYKTQKMCDGKIYYHGFQYCRYLYRNKRSEPRMKVKLDTGSVATDTFSLFETAGFKNFILVGQDLAYDANGFSHTGNERENTFYEKLNMYNEAEGIYGGKVVTREEWDHFRSYYEERIANNPSIRVIDATEGGALIHGSEVKTLREALNDMCQKDYPVDEWLENGPKGDDKEKQENRQWLIRNLEVVKDIEPKVNQAVELNKKIRRYWEENIRGDAAYTKYCRQYDELYKFIMECEDGEMLRRYSCKQIQNYLENALVLEGDTDIYKKLSHEYELFTSLSDMAEELRKFIEALVS